jgi:hypothetical protein
MEAIVLLWIVMACNGFFCVGYLFGNRNVFYWRIKWIEAEHDMARAQGRKPRNISEMENKSKS